LGFLIVGGIYRPGNELPSESNNIAVFYLTEHGSYLIRANC